MKYLITILLFAFSSIVYSAPKAVYLDDLTEEQRAQIMLQVAKMKKSATNDIDTEKISKWVTLGKEMGTGLAASAKELGMTANELAKTPVGMFIMFLIGWSYFGSELVSIIFSVLWLLFTIPTWIYLYKRYFILESIEYYSMPQNGKKKVKTFKTKNKDNDGVHFLYFITLLLIIVIGVVTFI